RRFASPAIGQARENEANEETAKSGGAEQQARRRSRLVHDFRDIERSKYILQKEPGDKTAGPDAAQPNVAKAQNRKITSNAHAAVSLALFFRSLWFTNEFPDQNRHEDPGQAGHEKSPSPAPTRCNLGRQNRSGAKSHQGAGADDEPHIPSAAARWRRLFSNRVD